MDSSLEGLYDYLTNVSPVPWYHLVVEFLLVLWIVRLLFFAKKYKPETEIALTKEEEDEMIREYQPEPLVPSLEEQEREGPDPTNRTVNGIPGPMVNVDGKDCINLASLNFLNLLGAEKSTEAAIEALRKYGVGSCGPRGFYGTFDVHLSLEKRISKFMQTEETIIYSYGFATISTALPAYAKRSDVIFCDAGAYMAIQKGVIASRSKVYYFKHNDMDDLERLMEEQEARDRKDPKKASAIRRFLVVEGLYYNYGDLAPLPRLLELKRKYKVRIFMDESLSFGLLGKTGRGLTEYYDIPVTDIDCICGSLEYTLASCGGFSTGSTFVIHHQQLSAQGYCFSASLPPMLSVAAMNAIDLIDEQPELLTTLQEKVKLFRSSMSSCDHLELRGAPESPVIHVALRQTTGNRDEDQTVLSKIVDAAFNNGVAITIARYLKEEEAFLPPPSIRVAISIGVSDDNIKCAAKVICQAAEECCD